MLIALASADLKQSVAENEISYACFVRVKWYFPTVNELHKAVFSYRWVLRGPLILRFGSGCSSWLFQPAERYLNE